MGVRELARHVSVLVEADLATALIPEAAHHEGAVGQDLHRLGGVLDPLRPTAECVSNPRGCITQRLGARLSFGAFGLACREDQGDQKHGVGHILESSPYLGVCNPTMIDRLCD